MPTPPALPALPVLEALPALAAALSRQRTAVLTAPPGSGKTTVVPLALLAAPWLAGRRILMLEPRRIAARASAVRMAELLGEKVGETVGYQVRFERRIGSRTRIEVVTEGLLTRRLQADPELPGVGLVIFDEFHERSLQADLALALTLDARAMLGLDVRVLVMSATLDAQRVAALLDDAPVVHSDGRLFPVDLRYHAVAAATPAECVAAGVRKALAETAGGVLAFLPGGREIRETQRLLASSGAQVYPLYGNLPAAEQDAALYAPSTAARPKVVLATNLAQTSLTVEGIATVVDGGQVRAPHYDLGAGANALVTEAVSRASADQRAGRAGRLGPGVAYRLWSRERHAHLPAHDTPEILAADLSGFALELALWGTRDIGTLKLLDAPPATAWAAAEALLRQLGAVAGDGRVTPRGRAMARLPLDPRRAAMLLEARARGLGAEAVWIAALLDARGNAVPGSDAVQMLETLCRNRRDIPYRMRETARQLARLLALEEGAPETLDVDAAGRVIALAYPERIARRRDGGQGVFLCADGAEARVDSRDDPHDDITAAPWLAIAHWSPGVPRRVRLAARVEEAMLREDHLERFTDVPGVRWDAKAGAVVAERVARFGAIELEHRPWPAVPAEQVQTVLLEGIRAAGAGALPWTDALRQWQARVLSVRAWRPQEDWPDVGDAQLMATLETWLAPALTGVTRLAQLARIDFGAWLCGLLTPQQARELVRLAPEHLAVPSGSHPRLDYAAEGAAPHLAVKLQELFGLTQTPTVDAGRMPVVLELLSPARRPIQTTRDLASFWRSGYAEVRRELRGRYPRHPWPEDPLAAAPTARAKPRHGR
ncbi:MAG: ATP-dependent helicase HrpB [Nevskiaceae bacterium]|nr:MAG: ATP-dependent helicase HrpB [Nevskiaceae bacterium]TBR72263.1 MAG: ATP-dependent helicase HrpB [Nevskiaceae bacterium]